VKREHHLEGDQEEEEGDQGGDGQFGPDGDGGRQGRPGRESAERDPDAGGRALPDRVAERAVLLNFA
jgi:hypothetical protein